MSWQESVLFYVNSQMTFQEQEAVELKHSRTALKLPLYTVLDSSPQGIAFLPWASCLRVGIRCPVTSAPESFSPGLWRLVPLTFLSPKLFSLCHTHQTGAQAL